MISTSFENILYYGIIGIQRMYNKLTTPLHLIRHVSREVVVTIKIVNNKATLNQNVSFPLHAPPQPLSSKADNQSTSCHYILVCTFRNILQKETAHIYNILFWIISFRMKLLCESSTFPLYITYSILILN